ncbi:MAG: hypothetical protein QOG64_1791 [Acidimicrobiaceae bacterium]|nr:hypothetical protein [Acidimicrobiaceae bacterium]
MEFGLLLGDVPSSVAPRQQLADLFRQVEAAQRNGFTLVTMGQHFLYGDVRWLQPIPTLARLAGEVDERVRLATTVLVAPAYHPVVLAEDLATLDIVTDGRLIVGLGMGYRREEFRQLGVPFASRSSRFEEVLLLLRELWTKESVTFTGRHWSLDDARPHIRPVQEPTPPVWVGANAEAGIRRSARLADAWPIGPRMSMDEARRALGWYFEERDKLGRPRHPQPIRREIVIGRDRADAEARFRSMTGARFAAYAERERGSLPGSVAEGEEVSTAIVGTAESVREELRHLAQTFPVSTVIVRAQWPGFDGAAVAAYLDELGQQVVAPLRDVRSCPPEKFTP